jgi:hypothetical protein
MKKTYDVISDVHSCFIELTELLEKLGYQYESNKNVYIHPESDRKVVFVGDLISRGPYHLATIFLIRSMINEGLALCVRGNHDDKIKRFAEGKAVILRHGDDKTAEAIENCNTITKQEIIDFFSRMPYYLQLDNELVVVHAAFRNKMLEFEPFAKRCRDWALYGPVNKLMINGLPDRIDWAAERKVESPIIVCGHQVYNEPRYINGVWQIDTGCCFGGKLTSVSWPEQVITQVKAHGIYDNSKSEVNT